MEVFSMINEEIYYMSKETYEMFMLIIENARKEKRKRK